MVCRSREAAEQACELVAGFLDRLKLTLHPAKTRVVDMVSEGFDFLGFHFHKRPSRRTGRLAPYAWPSQKAMKMVRAKIRAHTDRSCLYIEMPELVGASTGLFSVGAPTSRKGTPRRSWRIWIAMSDVGCGASSRGDGAREVG